MFRIRNRTVRGFGLLLAVALAATMLLAACGDNDDDVIDPVDDMETPAPATPTPAPVDDDDDDAVTPEPGAINITYIPGWPDAVSTSRLWKVLLEERGYEVELTPLDVAIAFAGLEQGDVDLYTSAWLPHTHGTYWQDEFEEIGVWYEPAGLFLTVPAYVEVDSLAELADNADLFNSEIQGIEAGAGMMGILRDDVMPTYGIDDWELIEASTPIMLAALDDAIANEEPIVVTLWSPGWWYGVYDLKNLDDPEGAWGDPDQLTIVGRAGFSEDFPEVAQWMSNAHLTDDQYAPLEELVDQMEGEEEEAVRQWLEDPENRATVDAWFD